MGEAVLEVEGPGVAVEVAVQGGGRAAIGVGTCGKSGDGTAELDVCRGPPFSFALSHCGDHLGDRLVGQPGSVGVPRPYPAWRTASDRRVGVAKRLVLGVEPQG